MTNKFTKIRTSLTLDKPDAKAKSKPEPIAPVLTPTPRERRATRREASLAEADNAVALRNKPKANGKI